MTGVILGVSKGRTKFGKELRDGGAALIRDGELLGAVAEERLSRTKHAGGSALSADLLVHSFGLQPSDVDTVVVSTCCEDEDTGDYSDRFPESEVISCNHHLSHAYGSFIPSGLDEAIVLVLDGGGNVSCAQQESQWWASTRDQQTYFLGHGHKLDVLERDFENPGEAGIGEIYRAFTYFLGWESSRKAGNVMSLAAYGDPSVLPRESLLWVDEGGRMRSAVSCTPERPIDMAATVLASLGREVQARMPGESITQLHCDIAAWLQSEVESALVAKVQRLIQQTGVREVCLAGGVAYNCRAVGRLIRSQAMSRLHVGPAAGDQGQCIGNAIYGAIRRGSELKIRSFSPYIGLPHRTNVRDIIDSVASFGPDLAVIQHENCEMIVAQKLASGAIGAVFQGRSEFGLRALGNRSIIAMPSQESTRWHLNIMKARNLFMPFAPVIAAESAIRYIKCSDDLPYMTAAVETTELLRQVAPAVAHIDGTARVQTVRYTDCPHLHNLLNEVERLTGHPILLNTSFNGGGQPIVESVTDAISTFKEMNLDFLWIENVLVEKRHCPEHLRDISKIGTIEISGRSFREVDLKDLIASPSALGLPETISVRDLFMLYDDYVALFRKGRKVTTIRYRKGSIDLPRRTVLPLYASANFSRDATAEYIGIVRIITLKVLAFGKLTDEDAVRDGFEDVDELQKALTEIYGNVEFDELVTVYTISQLTS